MSKGSFCLVLHGHLPYVLHQGNWPHGEEWLFEAAAETWLPLLSAIAEVHEQGGHTGLSLGLTPVLLEQLSADHFKRRFPQWLADRRKQAEADRAEFKAWGDGHLQYLAEQWILHFGGLLERFEAIGRDIPGAFAAHWKAERIEILSSNATHGYLPLLRSDDSARAQIRTGLRTSERILGRRPTGFWMPECAYRPAGSWSAPVLDGSPINRRGVEELLAEEGVRWVVVDAHLLRGARSEGIRTPHGYQKVGWDQASWDKERPWRSVLEPHIIGSTGQDSGVVAVARHPEVSEQVWSGKVGYPGDGRYLEFHKKHGQQGLRYWRVTSPRTDLGEKERYQPDQVSGAVYSHAQHFQAVLKGILQGQLDQNPQHGPGMVCAPFDAELFGHWWHEGPRFLRDLWLTLSADPDIELQTVSQRLDARPPQCVAWLPEGSWGEGGDHRVWLNEPLRWTWEVVHRAESRIKELISLVDHQGNAELRTALSAAAREALLMQASDWQFVIHTQGAVDYGIKRFAGHASAFDRLCDLTWAIHTGQDPDPALRSALELHQAQNPGVFEDLDLQDWQ
ncbi:MAG: 1,4-alpha-glucan branching protein domain-containing protein [Myxococcota bacterium]|nr:1,4-alpha-glucan branching protein domain-containing protein [Myxococcota bacterium]